MTITPNEERFRAALTHVVQYLAAERGDFEAARVEGRDTTNHIYRSIAVLEEWLKPERTQQSHCDADKTVSEAVGTCSCGGELAEIDRFEDSVTAKCDACQDHVLIRGNGDAIYLRDFGLKRGDGPNQRPLSDRTMAGELCSDLSLDIWPSPAKSVDFGIDSAMHYRELQRCVQEQRVTAYELDRVIGDGPAITSLVHSALGRQAAGVDFRTSYDRLASQSGTQAPTRSARGDGHTNEPERER